MSIQRLNNISITDDDISWIESIMGKNITFDDSRKAVIKNLESVDIQAFPGSGKTTTLVAKLAILAKKWPFSNAGICVLSHTNVAREEIESKLGNTTEGNQLLSYPHNIGTLHSFFDTFIVLPWLHSKGITVNVIDTDYVRLLRWKKLPYNTQAYFKRNYRDEQICSYYKTWGNINWDKQGNTRQELLKVISDSQNKGYFTFDEMLLLAQKVLDEYPSIAKGIQERFPVLFIDEAQDTNSLLWNLIHKAFPNDSGRTIRQGFGDSNQAIYNYINEDAEYSDFPRDASLILNESRRFDNRIAMLANSVAVSKERMSGTNNVFSNRDIQHTIFLFSKEKASCVIDEFAHLILHTFSDEELQSNSKLGCHIIGMVHKKINETPEHQFPKGIFDYWSNYDSQNATQRPIQQFFIDYFRIGKSEFSNSGDTSCFINWLANGMCRVINKAAQTNLVIPTNNSLVAIERILPIEKHQQYRQLMLNLAFANFRTKDDWSNVIKKVEKIIKLLNLSLNSEVLSFLKWIDAGDCKCNSTKQQAKDNHYIYINPESGRCIDLEFGSIHSVKGRTHLATLVLETFSKAHNIKSILNYLCGNPPKKITPSNLVRLKCQYVAMSRATALLCLAIPIDFVDSEKQIALSNNGWQIKIIK